MADIVEFRHLFPPGARSTVSNPFTPSERTTTGIAGLDQVLCGGLLKGSVCIVQGSPGAGKTIIANQMAFAAARTGERALYVTLLSESHGRLLRNLSTLSFFEEQCVGDRVRYVSGFDTLEREGAKGILRLIATEVRTFAASVVIVDGLFVLGEAAESVREFRVFVNAMALQAEALGCTALLLTNSQRQPSSAEYTMVDAWIEVCMQPHAHRTARTLQVHKLRGSNFLPGLHSFIIDEDGVTVLPRLETLEIPPDLRTSIGKVSSGHPFIDEMLGGGIEEGSISLIVGPPGTGKTTLGLRFLSGASSENAGLLFGFYEAPGRLLIKADGLGLPLREKVEAEQLHLLWQPATEAEHDLVAHRLLEVIRTRGIRRLCFDGLNGLNQATFNQARLGAFFAALAAALRRERCTTFFTCEISQLLGDPGRMEMDAVSAISDNIILLRHAEVAQKLRKSMVIVKTRDSAFAPDRVEFVIGQGGLQFAARDEALVE